MPDEEQEAFYLNSSVEELYKLSQNGDEDACGYYVRRKIEQNAVDKNDVKMLEAAINNLNSESAITGYVLFGHKYSAYKNPKKEFLCCAVLEQYGIKFAHKRLKKAYKKNFSAIDKTDYKVLSRAVDQWTAENSDAVSSFRIEAEKMSKDSGFPQYRRAITVTAYITEASGRETEGECIYVGYLRCKKEETSKKRLQENLIEIFTDWAEKYGIHAGELNFDGQTFFRYGKLIKSDGQKTKDGVKILSEAKIDISVSEQGRLISNVCRACGGALDENGVCISCGAKSVTSDDGIVIRKGKETEALLCTQCGCPVHLEKDDKTAYCPACGTTFAVNGSSLAKGIFGINYEDIKADMPEGATLPDVQFVRAKVADGAITAIMPRSFEVMSERMRKLKYNKNAPKYIYTTPDSLVNLNFNFLNSELGEKDVFTFGQQMTGSLKNIFPNAKFGEAKTYTEPRNIYLIEFITPAMDQPVYNAMFFFSYEGKQGIGSWNCLGKDRWFWAPVFEHTIKTIKFKS